MGLIKNASAIQALRESGKILAEGLFATVDAVTSGITTDELDQLFLNTIKKYGAEPSFTGYRGYPKAICTSVNDEVVHAIPSNRTLKEGDIIGVDCGVRYKGYCTDMARTVGVGVISEELERLLTVTQDALYAGIDQLHPGNRIGDIGAAIQSYAEQERYGIVRALVGHGVGEEVHEDPQIPNYGKKGTGDELQTGMVLAIEPMFTLGTHEVVFDEQDGWTVRTADGSFAAHFEETVVVLEEGPEILTKI